MAAILIVVVLLLALGVLGAVLEGLLWLTAIAVVLVLVAVAYGWWRLKRTDLVG